MIGASTLKTYGGRFGKRYDPSRPVQFYIICEIEVRGGDTTTSLPRGPGRPEAHRRRPPRVAECATEQRWVGGKRTRSRTAPDSDALELTAGSEHRTASSLIAPTGPLAGSRGSEERASASRDPEGRDSRQGTLRTRTFGRQRRIHLKSLGRSAQKPGNDDSSD